MQNKHPEPATNRDLIALKKVIANSRGIVRRHGHADECLHTDVERLVNDVETTARVTEDVRLTEALHKVLQANAEFLQDHAGISYSPPELDPMTLHSRHVRYEANTLRTIG